MKFRTLLLATLMAAMVASGLVVSVDQGVGRASSVVHFGAVGPVDVTVWGQTSLTPTTMVSLTTEIALTFGLRTDRASLEAHAIAVSDPKSADYGKFDSVATTGARFNASDQALSTIENWFASHNVQIAIDATRSYATASVPLSVVEQMIGTTYGTYAAAGVPQNLVLLTPTAAVSTLVSPLHEVIDRVAGATALWDTTSNSQSPLAVPPESDLTHYSPSSVSSLQPAFGGTPERTGTFVDGCAAAESVSPLGFPMGLSPAQLRTAYGIDHLWNAGYRGRGARIAVLDFNGYLHSDIDVWRDCFGLAGTPVTDHIVGSPGFDPGVSDETTLDIQTVISFAPDADRIDWFGVEGSATTLIGQYLQLFSAPLDASKTGGVAPDVLTASFGNCETNLFEDDPSYLVGISIFDQVLATAVASGIGAFASTGDTGSTGCYPNGPGTPNNTVAPQFPALSRWITAVGGTNLTLGEDNRIVSSGVWNDRWYSPTPLPQDGIIGSGGGGLSQYERRQPWQPMIGTGLHRPIPDISAFADEYPGYFLYYQGQWMAVGGTSASTPFSATAFALQSSARVAQGRTKLGFVAPLLHQLASSGDGYASRAIVDVVLGNNDAHLVGVYPAVEGYDLASGLGWVDHGVLFELLNRTDPSVPKFTG